MNYYSVLGVQPAAEFETIKAAYLAKASACHPDHGGSHEQMLLLNEAWDVLADQDRRRSYDEYLTGQERAEVNAHVDDASCIQVAQGQARGVNEWFRTLRSVIVSDFANASFRPGLSKWCDWDIAGDSVSGWAFFMGGALGGTMLLSRIVSPWGVLANIHPMAGLALVATAWLVSAELAIWAHSAVTRVLIAGSLGDPRNDRRPVNAASTEVFSCSDVT